MLAVNKYLLKLFDEHVRFSGIVMNKINTVPVLMDWLQGLGEEEMADRDTSLQV